jgi:hypothetical protein
VYICAGYGGWFGFGEGKGKGKGKEKEKEKDNDYMGKWDGIYAWQITRVVKLLVQYPISHFPETNSTPLTTLPFLPILVAD